MLDLEAKARKEQEELQTRLTKLKQGEIVDLQEVLARKARIAKKEIEGAKASSSCGSSLRSISTVGTQDDNPTKISGCMDKTEEAENLARIFNVPSVFRQTSVLKPVNTVQLTCGGHFSAQARDLKHSVKPLTSTEAAVRDIKRDRTKR